MMDTIQTLALGLVITVVIAAIGAMVISKFKGQITDTNSTEYQVLDTGASSMKTLADFLPIIVVAGIGFGIIAFFLMSPNPGKKRGR